VKKLTFLPLAGLVFAAACADIGPTDPHDGADSPSFSHQEPHGVRSSQGLDAEFVQIARDVPGFGGMFYDEAGNLNVYMTTGQLRAAGTEEIKRGLGRSLQGAGRDVPTANRIVIREGQHDFIQLDRWHQQSTAVLGLRGVVFTDIDETQNRLRIGIESGIPATHVEQMLQMAGIPLDAVEIEVTEPIVAESDHTLRNRQRPIAGGLQINFTRVVPGGISGFNCTLGFNILRGEQGRSVNYFVTNSHCSDTRGEVAPTPYWQHSRFAEETFIGWEFMDPAYFTGDPCPAGRRCRYSDAAIVRYERGDGASVAFGEIYRTKELGSLEIEDEERKFFRIVGEQMTPVIGQVLHKVGRTSGWTTGAVTATCVRSNVASSDITMLCQDRVATASAGGDSGAPYFLLEGNNAVLAGIHWGSGGGTTVLSSMANIRMELGPFSTH
jgi:hypothetical protein